MTREADRRRRTFEAEVTSELRAVYAMARHLCGRGGEAEAEDLTQETYARAFSAWDRFEAGTSARAWLLAILRNLFLRRRRDALRHPTAELAEVEESVETQSSEAEPRWAQVTSEVLEAALRQVPLRYREPVMLRDLQGLSYREIAYVLELPPGTAMSRLQRGRDALRRALMELTRAGDFDGPLAGPVKRRGARR